MHEAAFLIQIAIRWVHPRWSVCGMHNSDKAIDSGEEHEAVSIDTPWNVCVDHRNGLFLRGNTIWTVFSININVCQCVPLPCVDFVGFTMGDRIGHELSKLTRCSRRKRNLWSINRGQ